MKLTVFLIFLSFVQLMANNSYAQKTKLSVDLKNTSIEMVLLNIENQSKFKFIYNKEKVDVDSPVSIQLKEKSISETLDALFEGKNVSYTFYGNQVILTNSQSESAPGLQQKPVSGKVTDSTGAPLPGVAVVIRGTTQGTITDANGNYSLSSIPENAILQFSFVGMITQEIPVSGKTNINVIMAEDVVGIEEVVAIGYGIQKKVNITGAVDIISNEQLQSRPASNISQMLQGQAPGLEISTDNYGFQPGAEMSINIRGIGSLNGGSPYVIIDGFPGDLNRINPEDVESISVLKDAAASAIYGARAPYGVILITTKSGKKKTKLTANYSGNVSVHLPHVTPDMLDSYTFARVYNEASLNRGGLQFSEATIDRIIAYQNEDWDYLRQFAVEGQTNLEAYPSGSNWASSAAGHANNNWFDIHLGSATNQRHNFSVQGGSDKTSYYISAGYVGQESIIVHSNDKFTRFNLLAKLNTEIADWWDFSYEPRFMRSKRVRPNNMGGRQGNYAVFFHNIARYFPTTPLYDGFGNYNRMSYVPYVKDAGYNNYNTNESWQNFTTEIRPVKGWKVNADFAYKMENRFEEYLVLAVPQTHPDGSVDYWNTPNSYENYHYNGNYYTTNIYSTYELNIKEKHNLLAMVGWQYEYERVNSMSGKKTNMIVQDVPSLKTSTGDVSIDETMYQWATEGVFGRLTYNFDGKYLLESNVRYDGTSRFKAGNRWGFFPSFSAGWIVSNENFWESISPVVNYLKFRGSYGSLGNQNVASYLDLDLINLEMNPLPWVFGYRSSLEKGYTRLPDLVSRGLKWETATTKNLGVNMAFLDQRLQFDFDLYERTTTDMIGPSEPTPGILGSAVPKSNNATLRTRGWEAQLRWKQSLSNDFSYFVNLNIYDSKSVVTEYNNPNYLINDWYAGKEVGEIWGYTVNGLFKSQDEIDNHADQRYIYGTWRTGDVKYEDIKNDGKIDEGNRTLDDRGDLSIIGNSSPRYQFGISAGLNFKGFDFSMLWKGTAKRDMYYGGWGGNWYFGFISTSSSTIFPQQLDYYRDKPGDKLSGLYEGDANINLNSWFPRPYLNSSENLKNSNHPNTRYLQDYSYMRLQNIQLGYTLPKNITSRVGLSNLRVYFSGENLWTLKHIFNYLDPVATQGYDDALGKTYGAERIFSLGLNITY